MAAAEFDAAVSDWAGKLAAKSPVLMRMGKDAMFRQQDMALRGRARVPARPADDRPVSTEDILEGVTAFFEKREPRWTGR